MKNILILFSLLTSSFVFSLNKNDNVGQPCPDIVVSGNDVTCYGGLNGAASVSVYNGSGNYTYTWSNGANISSINALPVGTYTVTVKDNISGCAVTGAYVVDAPDPINVVNSISNVKCHAANTGEILLTVTGGTVPYSFSWENSSAVPVSTNQNLNNVGSDTYSLTITDNHNCTYYNSYTITQPAEPISYSSVLTDASCYNTTTGEINIDIWGGTPSYTYFWNTGASTQDIDNLATGNYNVTITDFYGCQLFASFFINQPAQLSATISSTDVICFGESNGSIQASLSGGTLPYAYAWQNSTTVFSANSPILNDVPADNYQVTITDKNGCSIVETGSVIEPSEMVLTHTFNDISCYGGSDGNIEVNIFGGTVPYTYSWSDGVSTIANTQDLNNIVAGTYTLVAKDQNLCSKTFTQKLKQPLSPISVVETVTNVKCYGNNTGKIDLAVSGGTSPYSYSWTTGQTSNTISNLVAQTYNYVVVDSKNCTYTDTVLVVEPNQPLTITEVITNVNCFDESNGGIDLTVTGGTIPYSYSWNNSSYSLSTAMQDLINIPSDNYAYLITDANNCTHRDTLFVSQPLKLQSTIAGVNILCKGGLNGSIDLEVTGGVTPYQYSWNNNIYTQDQSNLPAGFYEILITDAHNCNLIDSIKLTEPNDSLGYGFEVQNVKCNDGQDGRISIDITGGTAPYSYIWSSGDTTSIAENLTSANYQFIVTDFNGCIISDSIFVDQPAPLVLNEVITVVTCYGLSDGKIDISPTGGTAPFDYKWFNSDYVLSTQEEDLIEFPADTYQVEIRDSNHCFYEMFIPLTQPDSLVVTYITDIVSCSGGEDGNIFVTITGGNPAYNTTWSTGATTQNLTNIAAGHYELNVIDQKGCADSIQIDITQPDPITMLFKTTEVSCIDQHDGTALAKPTGGNGGYTFGWSNGATNSLNTGLYSQYYSVTVVDIMGCYAKDSVFINNSMSGCIDPVNAFTPNGDAYNDTWVIDNMDLYPNAELQIFNKWGNILYKTQGIYNPWNGVVNGQSLPSEVYYYIINLNYKDRKPLTGNVTIIR